MSEKNDAAPAPTEIGGEDWESLLHRAPLLLDQARTDASLRGKRILVTGAGGWIGSALTRSIARFAPDHLILLEAAESNLYQIDRALQQLPLPIQHTPVLGSVTQPDILANLFQSYKPQIVFHAAAFKHVPLMERNPFAAVENNAIGTHLLVKAAAEHQVEQFILLSTDKAVDPVSIMGASKRFAELILLDRSSQTTRMKAIRLGNVLGSQGSVAPLFLEQVLQGGPVTVTHPDVRRYLLTTEDAVALLLGSASIATEQCILVPMLGEPVSMEALARYLITRHANSTTCPTPIVFTQLRPGDKMEETLISRRERYLMPYSGEALRAVVSPCVAPGLLHEVVEQMQQACRKRSVPELLAAVLRAVPEYQPSTWMQTAAQAGERAALAIS